jgi:hypothetical protein
MIALLPCHFAKSWRRPLNTPLKARLSHLSWQVTGQIPKSDLAGAKDFTPSSKGFFCRAGERPVRGRSSETPIWQRH